MRFFYSLLMYLLWPVWLLITIVQACRRQGGWRFLSERLGWSGSSALQRKDRPAIWFHAASVGELRSILPLVLELAGDQQVQVFVSTNTPEAMRELQQFARNHQLEEQLHARYCAIDFYFATNRMVSGIAADALWVVETELWPNLFSLAKQHGMLVGILNGRLSGKTLNASSLAKSFYRKILSDIDCIAARSSTDRQRFIELGAKDSTVREKGNLKRTVLRMESKINKRFGLLSNRNYVLALSTRENEELLLWDAWQQLADPPLLVVAPRHIRRAGDILNALKERGVKVAMRSRGESILADTQVYLADSMGEAEKLAMDAQWVFVGGSLVERGGHNVLEPAMWGKHVVCGPFDSNVADDVEWLKSLGCLTQIAVPDKAGEEFSNLLASSSELNERCELAQKKLRDNSERLLGAYIELCLNSLR